MRITKNMKEAIELLRIAANVIYNTPNKGIFNITSDYRDTYELAQKIENFVNKIEND